jgi:hypothetical protein
MLVWFLACASISMPMSTDRWHDFDTFLTEFFFQAFMDLFAFANIWVPVLLL